MMADIRAAFWGLVAFGVSLAAMSVVLALAQMIIIAVFGSLALWLNMLILSAILVASTVLGVLATRRPGGSRWPAVLVVLVALSLSGLVLYGVIAG